MSQQNFSFSNKISNNGAVKVSAASAHLYIVAVTSVEAGSQTITFEDDAALGVLEVPTKQMLSLPIPIRCKSFTPSHADLSIVYFEDK